MVQLDTAARPLKRRLSEAFGSEEPTTQPGRREDLSNINQENDIVNHDGKETQISEHLCDVCSTVDWNHILHNSTAERHLGYLDECTSLTCPICHIVRQSIKEHWDLGWPTSPAQSRPRIYVQSKLWYNNSEAETEPDLYRAILALTCQPPKLKPKRRRLLYVDGGVDRFIFCELELDNPSRLSIEPHLDITKVKSWIQGSRESIKLPVRSAGSLFQQGFRLIDVEDECLVMRTDPCEYSALSYVWGPFDPLAFKTTTRNLSDLSRLHVLRRFPSSSGSRLQSTIADAIELTKKIGLRYLWVDALCIVQDDKEEKRRLIHGMNQVYENASITIIAAEGSHADAGLPGIRPRKFKFEEKIFNISTAQYTIRLAKARKSLIEHVRQGAWTDRAWTYQELSLSPFRLFMCSTEAFFDHYDYATQFREGYELATSSSWTGPAYWARNIEEDIDPSYLTFLSSGSTLNLERFSDCVTNYTRKYISFPEDLLHAFSGMYNQFDSEQRNGDEDHLGISRTHGTPIQFFPAALCWFPDPSASEMVRTPLSGARWSWTASQKPVDFVCLYASNFKGEHANFWVNSLVDLFHLGGPLVDGCEGSVPQIHAITPTSKISDYAQERFDRAYNSLEDLVPEKDTAISQQYSLSALSLASNELGFRAFCLSFVNSFESVFTATRERWWKHEQDWFRFDYETDNLDRLVILLWDGSIVALGVKAEEDAWVRVGIASLSGELIGWKDMVNDGRIRASWEYVKLR